MREFLVGNYATAFEHFGHAVEADPNDAEALFHRAVTRARLGQLGEAEADLREVLRLRPDRDRASLELGMVLVESKSYAAAIPFLERAAEEPDLAADASFFLGFAQLHVGDTEAARRSLERAAEAEELRAVARFYYAVADFRDRRWMEARRAFEYVADAKPDTEIGRQAALYLEQLTDVRLYGNAGFEYDSNVQLAPSNDAIKTVARVGDQSDGRFAVALGGRYSPWRSQHARVWLAYDFAQTVQFGLDQYNLQSHRPNLQFVLDGGLLRAGLLARYSYYFLQDDSFLQEGDIKPWVVIPEAQLGRTEIFYRLRRRDFLKRPFNDQRSDFDHATGIRQFLLLQKPERYAMIGYRFDYDDPVKSAGDPFEYDGHQVEAGFGWDFPAEVIGELRYAFRHESYANASGGRRDDEHRISVLARKRLWERFAFTAAYFGMFNDSNRALFEYDRHVGSLSVEVTF